VIRMHRAPFYCVFPLILACQVSSPPASDPITTIDPDLQLVSVAESVERSLRTLAEAQEEQMNNAINTAPLVTKEGGMGGRIDIDWTGPIGPLVQRIADMSQYHVKVFGPEPEVPVVISVSGKKRVIADVLKDAGLQAGKRAQVIVFPTSRVIELRYQRT